MIKVFVLFLMIFAIDILSARGFNYIKIIQKAPTNRVIKANNNILNSVHIKSILRVKTLNKITPKEKMINISNILGEKYPYTKKLYEMTRDPIAIVVLYSKYGDSFIKTSKYFNKSNKKFFIGLNINKTKSKLPNIKLSSFNSSAAIKRYVEIIKDGGKRAFEISKQITSFALKNKNSILAGVLTSWFLTDPVGFNEALLKAGGKVSELANILSESLGETISNTAKSSVNGFFKGLGLKISFLYGLFLIILGGVFWWYKGIIFRYLKLNRLKKEKELDEEIDNFGGGRL